MNKLCKELWEEIMVESEREEPSRTKVDYFQMPFFLGLDQVMERLNVHSKPKKVV